MLSLHYLNLIQIILFQNKILGGFHIISIHNEHGELIFKENSQKPQTFRPWFITNCTESVQNIHEIAAIYEKEIIECTNMDVLFNDKNYTTQLEIFQMMDSKLIDLATGLGGAFCKFFLGNRKLYFIFKIFC